MNTMKKCSTCGLLFAGDLCPKCMAGFAQKSTEPTAPPEELPLKPGQSFHGLEILELLGKGGMGVVYKARQPALDRMVALKILPQKMALDPDFQGRFIREAKALGSLNHPNIVAVYDFGADSGLFFFAMEYVDGTNLRQILRDRKLTSEQALKIVPQLCDALEYAHGEGIVHRDIKPENILLDRKGRVKIADFGLAKLVGADVAAAGMLTMTNMVMGTPHYMAPEQVENPKGVDHRADIYAIGVVFYEMLTGELPIGRFELPSKKVQIDVRLDDVVLKALEKSPDRRYQNASDIKDAVTKATAVSSVESYSPTVITPKPERKDPKFAVWAIGAAVLVSIAMIFAMVKIFHKPEPDFSYKITATPVAPDPVPPPVVKTPEPIDLTRIYFGPDERPGGYVFQGVGAGLPRNPMPAKEPGDIDVLLKILDDIGVQNISRSDVKQGYLAAWFRFEAAFMAFETSIPDRMEREFMALHKIHNRWAYRSGPLLVIAWSSRKERRPLFIDLVTRLQKKLGIPEEPPEIALENLKLDRSDLPSEWSFREESPPAPGPSGLQERYEVSMEPNEGASVLEYRVWVGKTAKDADAFAAEKLGFAGRRKVEIRRSGRTVAALALQGSAFGAFEKVMVHVRRWMGFPDHTFETVSLASEDVPQGFSIDKIENDPAKVLQAMSITGVLVSDVPRAAYYRLKPYGLVVVVEAKESRTRSVIEQDFKRTGASLQSDSWVVGIEGPDDGTLDLLENRMREKIGWDTQYNRYVTIPAARLQPSDLPPGCSIESVDQSDQMLGYTIKGPNGPLSLRISVFSQHPAFMEAKKPSTYKPGDVLFAKDTDYLVAHLVGAGEADWPVLDTFEGLLRKKLRAGPPQAEEFAIDGDLPKDCKLSNRRDLGFSPNPRLLKSPTAVRLGLRDLWATELSGVVRAWAAVIDPGETQVYVFQTDGATKLSELSVRLRKASAASKHLSIREKGDMVVVVRSDRAEDGEFKAIDAIVRAKLRAK